MTGLEELINKIEKSKKQFYIPRDLHEMNIITSSTFSRGITLNEIEIKCNIIGRQGYIKKEDLINFIKKSYVGKNEN